MEIFGIGTDIIECPRIGKMIEHHGELFLRRVYTEREIRYCQARKHAIEHFAGRWAAKEAILKAMGTGRSHGISWTNVEVRNGQDGRPQVLVCGAARETAVERGIGNILISISHCRTYATAYALALGRPRGCAQALECDTADDLVSLPGVERAGRSSGQSGLDDLVDLGERGVAGLARALALADTGHIPGRTRDGFGGRAWDRRNPRKSPRRGPLSSRRPATIWPGWAVRRFDP